MLLVKGKRGLYTPVAALYAATAAATTTWDPANTQASITLSPDKLTTTGTGGGFNSTRSIASHSSGKYYWEDTMTNGTAAEPIAGFANGSFPISGDFVGQTLDGVGFDSSGNGFWKNSANTGSMPTAGTGDVVAYALDLGNLKFWARVIHSGTPGNWNNSGTDNPATNTGGFSISGLNAGPYFAVLTTGTPTQITTNFGGSAFAATAPSGFGNW